MEGTPTQLAAAYAHMLASIGEDMAAAEGSEAPVRVSELEVQQLWQLNMLVDACNPGITPNGRCVVVHDVGEWNRGAGPDFLRAHVEVDGRRLVGDVEIDMTPQDWMRHRHHENALYNNVVLHVVLAEPPPGWSTCTECFGEVQVLYLPPEHVRRALGAPKPPDGEIVPLCRSPLDAMDAGHAEKLLRAAAAHRAEQKRRRFARKAEALGTGQAWYEAWAETLGYSANKHTMQALARRAPLHSLGDLAESILFGTAQFLRPQLRNEADEDAVYYNRFVWEGWWRCQDKFALEDTHAIPWVYAGIRPLNHPHRRVAALALSVLQREQIRPLLKAERARELSRLLCSISHPFWDYHCTLTSPALGKAYAPVGRDRVRDFLVNHVYVLDSTRGAWEAYLKLGGAKPPGRVERVARGLFGTRSDLQPLLRRYYAQQGLLQIADDFCAAGPCNTCLFPEQLRQWN